MDPPRHPGREKENSSSNRKEGLRKSSNNALKVKYISNPMRVKTSATRFRSLVQQLTGKNSDVEWCMVEPEHNAENDGFHQIDDHGAAAYEQTIRRSSREEYCPVGVLPSDISSAVYPYQIELLQSYDHQL